MKDAVGSSVLFYVILIFLAIFIIFIAFIMQYATAYRASNYVVTMLERKEGRISPGSKENSKAEDEDLTGYLKQRLYYGDLSVVCNEISINSTGKKDEKSSIFKVKTVIKFDLPLIDVHIPIYINNETKTIYNVPCSKTYYTNPGQEYTN